MALTFQQPKHKEDETRCTSCSPHSQADQTLKGVGREKVFTGAHIYRTLREHHIFTVERSPRACVDGSIPIGATDWLIHAVNLQTCPECLLCTRSCAGCWGHRSEKDSWPTLALAELHKWWRQTPDQAIAYTRMQLQS